MAKAKKAGTADIYRIIDRHDGSVVEVGFAKREAAKPRRNELNEEAGRTDPNNPRYIISRGEDHPHGPSNGVSTQRRGKNAYL